MMLSTASVLLATMLLQTFGATNSRVMLPLLIYDLGGDTSLVAQISGVRYVAIIIGLVFTPTILKMVSQLTSSSHAATSATTASNAVQFNPMGQGKDDIQQTVTSEHDNYQDISLLVVLLPIIAALSVAFCYTPLHQLVFVVATSEAMNCVVYVLLSSLSQTLPDRVTFTTRLRLVQSFGGAAIGPLALFVMSCLADEALPGQQDKTSRLTTPFLIHAVFSVALIGAVTFASSRRSDEVSSSGQCGQTKITTRDREMKDIGANLPTRTSQSEPTTKEGLSSKPQNSSFLELLSRSFHLDQSKDGRRLLIILVLQNLCAAFGDVVNIGLSSHMKSFGETSEALGMSVLCAASSCTA